MQPALISLVGCTFQGPPPAAPSATGDEPTVDTAPPSDPAPPVTARLEVGPPRPCEDAAGPPYTRVSLGAVRPNDEFGFGVAAADFDRNGWIDLAAATHDGVELFLQFPSGWESRPNTFEGMALDRAVGLSVADTDGDADLDLFVTRDERRNRLLRNDGTGFTDITAAAGILDHQRRSKSASWGDIDGDGDLDLWVGNYGDHVADIQDPALPPGEPSVLYRNRGDGTFDDISELLPTAVQDTHTFMTALYDIDEDGLPELFNIADFGWFRPSSLTWNRGGVLLPDDGTARFHPNFAGMGLGVGDLNRDGLPDFLQSSWETLSLLESSRNGGHVEWVETAQARGVAVDPGQRQVFGWGAAMGDLDNDADLDLVMGFGRWPEYLNPADQRDAVWRQDTNGFTPIAAAWGVDDGTRTRGLLLVDLDRDGFLDIVRRAVGEPLSIDISTCRPGAWSSITLLDPIRPNHAAVGAKVTLHTQDGSFTSWVEAGSSSMFSGGSPSIHFGLGSAKSIDEIEVSWPDGHVDHLGTAPNNREILVRRIFQL